MLFHPITHCRLCRGTQLAEVFNLGSHALSSRFPSAEETSVPAGPLEVVACTSCGLVQLRHNFDQDELYRRDYGYRSGITQTMSSHLADITAEAEKRVPLRDGDCVLDVGSNDATLLKSYRTKGLRRIGIDPTSAQYRQFYPPEILGVPDYFTAHSYSAVADRPAKVITSVAMFYDLHEPHAFVEDIRQCLDTDGMWIFEQSYIGTMLARNAFDTICHEHLEYYSLTVVIRLLAAHGLRVTDVTFDDINGGSFRVYACHASAPYREAPAVAETCRRETEEGLNTPEPMRRLRRRTEAFRDRLSRLVRDIRSSGRSIYLYGASTKGNTLLQYCQLDRGMIVAAADRSPQKWGRRTPGTDIPIISEEEARRARPDYFLVMPWHFRSEFVAREHEFLAKGGRMIFPLP